MTASQMKWGAILLGVGVVAYFAMRYGDKAIAKVGEIADTLNPTSDGNIVYKTTNAVGGLVAGEIDWTLGGWLHEKFSPDAETLRKMFATTSGAPTVPEINVKTNAKAPSAQSVLFNNKGSLIH